MAQGIRTAKRRRYEGPAVTITVGTPGVKTFVVHAQILKKSSKFFNAELSKDWKETATVFLDLPLDDPELANTYFDWLYSDKIATMSSENPSEQEKMAEKAVLARLYCYGEKLQDKNFCNAVMSAMLEAIDIPNKDGARSYLTRNCIENIYASTKSGSLLRRLAVQLFVDYGSTGWITTNPSFTTSCPEFLGELAVALLEKKNNPRLDPGVRLFERREEWFVKE